MTGHVGYSAICTYLISQLVCCAFPSFVFADPCPSSKIALWTGAHLHGANIFQGRNPEGGPNGFGDGEFTQSDFDDLAQAGANYIQISHAGIYAETSPYDLDTAAQQNLDQVIQMATQAGLYIGIAFRSGPGRNENAISNRDGAVSEPIWHSAAAQDAWVAMLRHVADRYKGNPHIVGYSVMVEPNAYVQHGYPSPQEFYDNFEDTLQDVSGMFELATAAIREVDSDTPILLEPEGYGGVNWLPYMNVTEDPKTVYTPHDYSPFEYATESVPGSTYPGIYDVDGDGTNELINAAFLTNYIGTLQTFSIDYNVPVAMTEFGVHRNVSNAAQYLADRISIQNPIGSWAVWVWQPAGFIDPFNMHDPSALHDILKTAWLENCTPAFDTLPPGNANPASIEGRAFLTSTTGHHKHPFPGITIRVGDFKIKTSPTKPKGSYSLQVTSGVYLMKGRAKGFSCKIDSKKKIVVAVSSGQTLLKNIYCRHL